MTSNLQDRIRALTDAPSSAADIVPPAAHRHRSPPQPAIATEPRAVHIRTLPGSITFAARRPALPAPVSVVGSFNFLKPPPALGQLFVEVIGPGGDIHHPTLDGMVARESAPGGFQSMEGRISERVFAAHPDVYRQDATMRLLREQNARCLHGGRLNAPDRSGGAVQLATRGHAQRAELDVIEPILYESQDMSIWRETAPDTDDTVQDRWTMRPREINRFRGEVEALSFEGPGSEGGVSAMAWLPGRDLARVAFKAQVGSVSSRNGVYLIVTSGKLPFSYDEGVDGDTPDLQFNWVNWEGAIGATPGDFVNSFDIDLSVFFTPGDDGAGGYGDNRGAPSQAAESFPDFVSLELGPDPDLGDPFPRVFCDLIDVRLYGAGGPLNYGDRTMSPSELVIDLFGRMGIRVFDVEPSGFNILPYELAPGSTFADGLDFASLLTNRPWVIRDTGHRAFGRMAPWNETTWEVASPWARLDTTGVNRYNAIRIPFTYKDHQTIGSHNVRADPDFLDHRSFFGLLGLDHPARSSERAEELGQSVLEFFATPQVGAIFDIGEVIGPQGLTSGQEVFAGHTLDGRPSDRPGGLHVVSLERGYDFVRGQCGFDTSSGASTGHPALDRMLARRAKRMAA